MSQVPSKAANVATANLLSSLMIMLREKGALANDDLAETIVRAYAKTKGTDEETAVGEWLRAMFPGAPLE